MGKALGKALVWAALAAAPALIAYAGGMPAGVRPGEAVTLVVDRVEDGGWAVLELPDGLTLELPAGWLPAGVQGGDVLVVEVHGTEDETRVTMRLDAEARAARLDEARRLREGLPKGPEGDLDL